MAWRQRTWSADRSSLASTSARLKRPCKPSRFVVQLPASKNSYILPQLVTQESGVKTRIDEESDGSAVPIERQRERGAPTDPDLAGAALYRDAVSPITMIFPPALAATAQAPVHTAEDHTMWRIVSDPILPPLSSNNRSSQVLPPYNVHIVPSQLSIDSFSQTKPFIGAPLAVPSLPTPPLTPATTSPASTTLSTSPKGHSSGS